MLSECVGVVTDVNVVFRCRRQEAEVAWEEEGTT
jgi:hypothetical protein